MIRPRCVEQYHQWYYGHPEQTWQATRWLGVPVLKCPLDLWVYQELVCAVQPRFIVETGTYCGGSALYLATVCEAANWDCQVITIDTERRDDRPDHYGITYIHGDSVARATVQQVRDYIDDDGPVLVILDSDHRRAHVLQELRAYAPLVTPGSYLIVEDTNLGYEVPSEHGAGPRDAVTEWLAEQRGDWAVDAACERFGMTFNPGGYLVRLPRVAA